MSCLFGRNFILTEGLKFAKNFFEVPSVGTPSLIRAERPRTNLINPGTNLAPALSTPTLYICIESPRGDSTA